MSASTIDYSAFVSRFKPQQNHLNDNAPYDGHMYETYGSEWAFVASILEAYPCKIWTVLDCDGEMIVSSGFHYVNRLGYIITEVSFAENEIIEIVDEA